MVPYVELGSQWRKSSHSLNDGNCVTVGSDGVRILIVDDTDPTSVVLKCSPKYWRAFMAACGDRMTRQPK
jgi:hypothetical protein